MPPTSPHHRAFFSNQPTIPTAGPQKGSASFLCPSLPLTRGISALPCATLRHIYTPFPRYSWCSFVSPSGFLRPIPKISKYFLARGDFFPKIWRANYGASRASLGGWLGGCLVLCLPVHLCRPSLWACQTVRDRAKRPPFLCPLSCPVINSALKMDYYTIQGGKMALRA